MWLHGQDATRAQVRAALVSFQMLLPNVGWEEVVGVCVG
jgi:hypothetical protein